MGAVLEGGSSVEVAGSGLLVSAMVKVVTDVSRLISVSSASLVDENSGENDHATRIVVDVSFGWADLRAASAKHYLKSACQGNALYEGTSFTISLSSGVPFVTSNKPSGLIEFISRVQHAPICGPGSRS